MPGERRTLRSNKDSTSSTNGEKSHTDSAASSNKDKPVPARTASSKTKTAPAKKGAASKDTDKPKANGASAENGLNGSEDVEMADGSAGHNKDGDDEMTVVVPQPNSSKLSAEPGKDNEGDVAMNGATGEDEEKPVEVVDPKVKAVTGEFEMISHDKAAC